MVNLPFIIYLFIRKIFTGLLCQVLSIESRAERGKSRKFPTLTELTLKLERDR